jgi:segregation and condensation protein B
MDYLTKNIEAIVFSSPHPVSLNELQNALNEGFQTQIDQKEIVSAISDLKIKYQSEDFSFELSELAEGFHFLTKPAYHNIIGLFLKQNSQKKLSRSALETLSIIAYKQPVSKTELEKIRGVNCDYTIQKLLEKELIQINGRDDSPGRPLLYSTSDKFLNYFGLNNIQGLPKLKEFENSENEIGIPDVENQDYTLINGNN